MLQVLGEAALRSLLLGTLVQCVLLLARVRQARLLLGAWIVVLAASVAMPVLPWLAPLRLPLDPALPRPLIEGAADLLLQPVAGVPPNGGAATEPWAQPSPLPWLEAVYLAVSCGILLRVLLGIGLSFRLVTRAVPLRPGWAAGHRVRISRDIAGPVTIGRVILLPPDALGWPAGTRRAVLAHEGAHVARRDFAMLVLSQLHRALFWFSPLPWWLHRRLVALAEMASDDQAMAVTGDPLAYAEILLEMGKRPGPPCRGLAMARPSTLLHRIDRILLGQASPCPVARPRQALLVAGVAGLSFGIASLSADPTADTSRALFSLAWDAREDHPAFPVSPIPEQDGAAPPATVPDAPSATTVLVPDDGTGMRSEPVRSLPFLAPPAGTAAQPSRPTVPPRPVPGIAGKAGSMPVPARVPGRPVQAAAGRAHPDEPSASPVPGSRGVAASATGHPGATSTAAPLAEPVAYGTASFQSGLDGIAGNTCAGTLAVGMRASGVMLTRPDVVPGESVPARAQFFRKENGVLWVRFSAFERPPLDVPVRSTRNGMTWIGEYGIAYTVQASGGSRLAGLAAPVASDSARLAFNCSRSASHPF